MHVFVYQKRKRIFRGWVQQVCSARCFQVNALQCSFSVKPSSILPPSSVTMIRITTMESNIWIYHRYIVSVLLLTFHFKVSDCLDQKNNATKPNSKLISFYDRVQDPIYECPLVDGDGLEGPQVFVASSSWFSGKTRRNFFRKSNDFFSFHL